MSKITPVVLCGGVGTRLWPMSRSQSPKQFHPVKGKGSETFFQATTQRHRGGLYGDPIVVTAANHLASVRRQLQELQRPARILAEPLSRNTGPAVLAAALDLAERDPDGLMLVLPSDHVIDGNFNAVIETASKAAEDGRIVLFGIQPSYPETGYGYIVDGGAFTTHANLHRVASFVEKPELPRAEALISTGAVYWASGISLFSARTIIQEFRAHDPATFEAVSRALAKGDHKDNEVLLNPEAFRRARNEPTERIVFEVSEHIALAPADISWSDVGCWTSIHEVGVPDANGNVFHGDVIATGTENALVRADKRLIAVVDVPEVIVIDTPDAVLVTRRGRCQNVKQVVETLREEDRAEAVHHREREHNWGQSVSLMRSGSYDMSVLRINAGTSIRIDPLPGRKLIVMSGALEMFDGLQRRRIAIGEHAPLDTPPSDRLTNIGSDAVEAVLLTARASIQAGTNKGEITQYAS